MQRWAYCLLVLLLHSIAAAQSPSVELQLPSRTLELGEAVDAQLVCTNTPQPSAPHGSIPAGLDVKLTNTTPFVSQQMSIVNGRRSQKSTYTFALRITALQEGQHTLGPFVVEADGASFQSEPVVLLVKRTAAAAGAKGDRFLFVETEVQPRSLYVTQSYTATLVIGIRKPEFGGRTYQLDYLRQVLDVQGSQLSIFEGGSARQSEMELPDSQGVRHSYVVYRVTKEVRADEVGEASVGPIFLRANYPLAVREGFFGRLEVTRNRKEVARADAIVVQVLGPPAEGRPASFNGALGNYTMEVSVKPVRVEQGQPVTLSLIFRGTPLEGLASPDLTRNAELMSRFDLTTDELVGDIESGAKIFRRAIFPKQAGDQTVPPLTWSFFDPKQERYVTVTSESMPISVDPRTSDPSVVTLPTAGEPSAARPALTLIQGGISANYVDANSALLSQTFVLGAPAAVLAFGLPPIMCLAVVVGARHRDRLQRDKGYAKRRGAARRAEAAVREAAMKDTPQERLTTLGFALSAYVADRFGVTEGTMTPSDARSLLLSRGVPEPLVVEMTEFLEACDAIRYASLSAFAEQSAAEAAQRVRDWIQELETRPA